MKIHLPITVFLLVSQFAFGQTKLATKGVVPTPAGEQYWVEWTKNLYERGVEISRDSIWVNKEAKRIMNDSAYRNAIYPKTYRWATAKELLKRMQLKTALWYMLNLYGSDTASRNLVMSVVLPYDDLYQMDRAMTASFYTYAMLDPSVCIVSNGRPSIVKPAELEKKFNNLKEIIGYIQVYRKQKAAKR